MVQIQLVTFPNDTSVNGLEPWICNTREHFLSNPQYSQSYMQSYYWCCYMIATYYERLQYVMICVLVCFRMH